MTLWQTIVLAFITGAVPGTIAWILNRRGANKKLELQEGTLSVTQFDAQTRAYQDLLDRGNAALAEANRTSAQFADELKTYKEEREKLMDTLDEQGDQIKKLQQADTDKTEALDVTNGKLETLRALFLSYIKRTGIPLTAQEQLVFDNTLPANLVRKIVKGQTEGE